MVDLSRVTVAVLDAWPALAFKGKGNMQIVIVESAILREGAYLKLRITL
jgi:hypothetical protein